MELNEETWEGANLLWIWQARQDLCEHSPDRWTQRVGKAFGSNQVWNNNPRVRQQDWPVPGQRISQGTTEPELEEPGKHCLHWAWENTPVGLLPHDLKNLFSCYWQKASQIKRAEQKGQDLSIYKPTSKGTSTKKNTHAKHPEVFSPQFIK